MKSIVRWLIDSWNNLLRWLLKSNIKLIILLILLVVSARLSSLITFECYWADVVWKVLLSVCIIILCGGIMAASYRPFKKLRVKLIAFLLLFCYSMVIYIIYHSKYDIEGFSKLLAALNNTFSIFFPSRGAYDGIYEDKPINQLFVLNFHLVHILAYLYAGMLAVSFFGVRIMNRLRRFMPYSERYIFLGATEQAKTLAKDVSNNPNIGVFMILPNSERDNKELFEELDVIGAVVIYRPLDGTRIDEITNRDMRKTNRYFFLDEDENQNASLALKIVNQLCQCKLAAPSHLYIKCQIPGIEKAFEDLNDIEIHIFSQSDLTAREFIYKHRMLDCPNIKIEPPYVKGEFNLLVLGFGWTGHEIMNKCICDSQYLGSTFSATVIDRDFNTKHGDYPILFDECIKEYHLKFITDPQAATAGSIEFAQWIKDNIHQFNRIIVALGNDKFNLDIATSIANIMRQQGIENTPDYIFAHIREKENFDYFKGKSKCPVTIFGDYNDIYTHQLIIDEQMDNIAKAVNYIYSQQDPFIHNLKEKECEFEREWKNCKALFNRDSSRATAIHISNIIRIAGEECNYSKAIWNPSTLEVLAENEHLRWCAYHYTKGIRKWNIADMPIDETESKKKHGGIPTHHACLMKFGNLKEVDDKINPNRIKHNENHNLNAGDEGYKRSEDMQENDRRIVRHFMLLKNFYQ